jgi:hypothetical protein
VTAQLSSPGRVSGRGDLRLLRQIQKLKVILFKLKIKNQKSKINQSRVLETKPDYISQNPERKERNERKERDERGYGEGV